MTATPLALVRRSALATTAFAGAGRMLNRTLVLPVVIFSPTSRCNSRCLSCDWWKSDGADDLTFDEIAGVADALPSLGTRVAVFSGGEPLLRADVFRIANLFRARDVRLHLLTSGLALERHAVDVARLFDRVVVSLDASTEELYRAVRGVAGLSAVASGVARLRALAPGMPVTARATLHRLNFRELPRLVDRARAMGLDGISFLAADVASLAFGRQAPLLDASGLLLDRDEIAEFAAVIERVIVECAGAFSSGFIAEPPDRLRRLVKYYAAAVGDAPFPRARCNAPWVSVVVEANGAVRPCFFHPAVGNVRERPLRELVTGALAAFRRTLDVATNATCGTCVCSLNAGWRNAPWQ
ncbi:MAG: radical SAM protein [Betaproteobacteria bacterium]